MTPTIDPLSIPTLGTTSTQLVTAAIAACDKLLMGGPRTPFLLTREWARRFPRDSGVYAVFDDDRLIYLGETGCIALRMADFLRSQNHVLRRSIGNTMFQDEPGFRKATSSRRFPEPIEERLVKYIETHLSVTAVIVYFGRTEIEEHLAAKYRPRYNSKGRRGTKLHGSASESEVA